MISRRRLDRLEQALDRARHELSPARAIERAVAAGAAGAWTWDDARLVFAERAVDCREALRQSARAWREASDWPDNLSGHDNPLGWVALIVTYRLDEQVPSELPAKLLRAAQSPGGWESYGTFNDAAEATKVMLALETPDAIRLSLSLGAGQVGARA